MNKKQIMDVAFIPTIILIALQLISFVTLLAPGANIYSSYSFPVLPLLSIILFLFPAIIYVYTGYSAVKNHKLKLGEAFLIGAMMSALMTLTSTLITAQMEMYQSKIASSDYIFALAGMAFGMVFGSLFNGFLALIGGVIAPPKPETSQAGRKPTDWLVIGSLVLVVILVIAFVLFALFYISPTPPRIINQCMFPAGFTCITNKLQAGTSQLYLKIGQGTGHTIQINGINCTTQKDTSVITSGAYVYYPNYNSSIIAGTGNSVINMSSGSSAILADGTNISGTGFPAGDRNIICSLTNDSIPGDAEVGSVYTGKIYINYTELDTNLTRIVVGTYTARYES